MHDQDVRHAGFQTELSPARVSPLVSTQVGHTSLYACLFFPVLYFPPICEPCFPRGTKIMLERAHLKEFH